MTTKELTPATKVKKPRVSRVKKPVQELNLELMDLLELPQEPKAIALLPSSDITTLGWRVIKDGGVTTPDFMIINLLKSDVENTKNIMLRSFKPYNVKFEFA